LHSEESSLELATSTPIDSSPISPGCLSANATENAFGFQVAVPAFQGPFGLKLAGQMLSGVVGFVCSKFTKYQQKNVYNTPGSYPLAHAK